MYIYTGVQRRKGRKRMEFRVIHGPSLFQKGTDESFTHRACFQTRHLLVRASENSFSPRNGPFFGTVINTIILPVISMFSVKVLQKKFDVSRNAIRTGKNREYKGSSSNPTR